MLFSFFFLMIRRPPRSTLFTRRSSDLFVGHVRNATSSLVVAGKLSTRWLPENSLLLDRKSTRLNSSHTVISYAVFGLKEKSHDSDRLKHCVSRTEHVTTSVLPPLSEGR